MSGQDRFQRWLACIPVVNDVIQQLGLPKVICDLLSQPCITRCHNNNSNNNNNNNTNNYLYYDDNTNAFRV